MRDEEFREAMRDDDPVRWKRIVSRASTEMLLGAARELATERAKVEARLDVIDSIAPHCRCGAIADGSCGSCQKLEEEAESLLAYWVEHSVFARWLQGSQELPTDAKKLGKAWCRAYGYKLEYDRRGSCQFPRCEDESYYCTLHSWLRLPEPRLSLATERRMPDYS